jgi:hypothetical protein
MLACLTKDSDHGEYILDARRIRGSLQQAAIPPAFPINQSSTRNRVLNEEGSIEKAASRVVPLNQPLTRSGTNRSRPTKIMKIIPALKPYPPRASDRHQKHAQHPSSVRAAEKIALIVSPRPAARSHVRWADHLNNNEENIQQALSAVMAISVVMMISVVMTTGVLTALQRLCNDCLSDHIHPLHLHWTLKMSFLNPFRSLLILPMLRLRIV